MRLVPVSELKPGMIVGRNIYGNDFRLLLNMGVSLTPALIQRLKELGLYYIYVKDEFIGQIEVQDILTDKLKAQSFITVRKCFEKAKAGPDIEISTVTKLVNNILDEVLSFSNLMVSLVDIRLKDSYLLSHSISVCTLSLLTGIALGFDQIKLHQLGIGALLHDIGKSTLESTLLNKSTPFTPAEEKVIQSHSMLGFEILRKIPEISILSAHVPFQHHERYDGKGYPRGINHTEIHPYAAITAIVNTFDQLVSPPQGKGAFPAKALEMILLERGRAFDPEIALAFARQISPYPIGCTLRLSTGELAVVLQTNKNHPTRPTVKVITNCYGEIQSDFPELDLSQAVTIKIEEVLSENERSQELRNYA